MLHCQWAGTSDTFRNGLEMTHAERSAKWQKTCRLKYNQTKLDRVRRKAEKANSGVSSNVTRSTRASLDSWIGQKEQYCLFFFCDKPSDSPGVGLHQHVMMISKFNERHINTKRVIQCQNRCMRMMMISKCNGTSTPKGSYSAKTGVNCPMSLNRVH